MNPSTRIHLLIPFLDGEYYGTIFTTLNREAKKRNALLYTIQALPSTGQPTVFNYQIGTSVADGWLLMANSESVLPASPEFLQAIEATGKPIVTIGYPENAIRCHSVLIENRLAAKESVLHLIRDHGHRRVAFMGCLDHFDLLERFEGYKEALREEGIPFDPDLCYHIGDSLRQGGVAAAKAMLARGVDFTALFATTDLNAMALIEILQDAGYRIPEDIALAAFDDMAPSVAFNPPLTTIRQSFSEMAHASIDLLFRQIKGEQLPHSRTYLPTRFIVRASCGCPYQSPVEPIAEIRRKWSEAETNIGKIIASHHQLADNWASATREENFHFSKMFKEMSHWGCLALWESDENERKHLIVKQVFSNHGDPVPPVGLKIPIESFPPPQWMCRMGENDFIRVQSICNEREDLGFIMIVGPIDELVFISAADISRISFTISVAALERDDLVNRIRTIAEQLEIVSRTTNDGIWDWNLKTNQIQWNVRAYDMLGSIGQHLTNDPESFFRLIHPDDYKRVTHEFKRHIETEIPLKTEFRILDQLQEPLWLYATGDSIRDANGAGIRMIGSLANISEKKAAEKQIMHLAFHDVLTGLPNRLLFQDRFLQNKSQADRHNYKLGIMLIDLDRFKIINDTLGHQAGDLLLQQVARILESTVRSSDSVARESSENSTVARLGGDEFIVMLSHVHGAEDVQRVADRIHRRINDPYDIQGLEAFTTASIGISMYPDDGSDLDTLKRCADIAMYKAKNSGRNRHEVYDSHINLLAMERFTLENQLRKALERGEFQLHYQPQIDLRTGKVVGVEALLRWNSAERGIVPPMDFIPLAEESGLILPIGQWVLEEACRQNQSWIEQGSAPVVVSVNISASQLQKNDFVEMVQHILEDTRMPPELLCLEITEGTAIKNMDNDRDKLLRLSELGVRLAIDDFGTGYSSLAMLKCVPITSLKIDRSFIQGMDEDRDAAAIVRAVIAMSRSLEWTVVAEGVETETQKKILVDEGCNRIQGFYYSEPLPAEDCLAYMRKIGNLFL